MTNPASQGPPPPNVSCAPTFVVVLTIFFTIALVFFAARLYTRIQILHSFWWDDFILSCAVLCAIPEYAMQMSMTRYGYGRHIMYLRPEDASRTGILSYITQLLWVWTVTLVKTSMALMLLRIKQDRLWKWGLVSYTAFQLATSLCATIVHFLRCNPIAANWNPPEAFPKSTCWTAGKTLIFFYILSSMFIASDIIFAFLPLTFIYRIRRPRREKIVLACLTGFGVFASAAATVKMVSLHQLVSGSDPTWDSVNVVIWSHLEEYVGVTAACIPCLKAPFERGLRRLGLLSTKGNEYPPYALYPTHQNRRYLQQTDKNLSLELQHIKTNLDDSDVHLVSQDTGREVSRKGVEGSGQDTFGGDEYRTTM